MTDPSIHTFEVLMHNKFLGFADGNILRWFPRLNLLAISMNKMSIWVYRLNGERVYSINNKSPIKAISFLNNGNYFCLSGMDNMIKIYDSNTGKLIKILNETFDDIRLISWSCHSVTLNSSNALFNINILKNIPKLTCNSSEVSSSNIQEIDELNNETLNYLLVFDLKKIAINFNNLLTVTDIEFPSGSIKFLEHFENNNLFDQCFLVDNENNLGLIKLSFKGFTVTDNKAYLVSIILDICKVISIMNYLQEQLIFLASEIKPFLELFDKYLSNFKDSLINNENKDMINNNVLLDSFYDMILTNIIPENLKDFWLNQFGERGIKRLSKVGNSMYDLLKKNIFTKLIAGLERLLIILNKFRGLSKWFKDSEKEYVFGLNLDSINEIIEKLKSLMKRFYQLIWIINEEQKVFNIFINWIKVEIIEKLSKEDELEAYINQQNSENFKVSKLMEYFENHLLTSKLLDYFQIDFSNSDVLEIKEPTKDVIHFFDELHETLNDRIIDNVKEFIRGMVIFSDCVPLNIKSHGKLKIKSTEHDTGTIIVIDNSLISLVKFSYTDLSKLLKTNISLMENEFIIEFDLKSDNELILLINSNNEFVLHAINLNTNKLNGDVSYDSLEKTKWLNITELQKPSYLSINESIGCILDSARKNYVVFNL